jgi:hypothetical protein
MMARNIVTIQGHKLEFYTQVWDVADFNDMLLAMEFM